MVRNRWLLFAIALLAVSAFARDLPDRTRTPGVANPAVTQDNIDQTICVSGWTATIRPPSSYTSKLKLEQIKEYRYADKMSGDYEEDNLISLQLGGHPTDPKNLWPQPYNQACGARIKDVLESRLKRKVCDRTLPLVDAQKAIATNWVAAYKKYVDREGCPALEREQ